MPMRMTMTRLMENNADRQSLSSPSATGGNAPSVAGRRPAASAVSAAQCLRVFIADDSRLMLERLNALLTTVEGVQIIGAARTVGAAIRGIQHLLPDLVILDFQLPDGNGMDVLKAIKQGKPDSTPPLVLMLTNFAYPQYRTECMQRGADYFFDKSQDFERVVEVCRHLLSEMATK